ncbi:glypican-6-like [Crassostrea virginica]
MADIGKQGAVQFLLTLCVFFILFVVGHCTLDLACIEVKKAYTEKGLNANEVPIQAISGDHLEVCPHGSTCCTRDMEGKLKALSAREYSNIIGDAFRYAKNTFITRTRKFDEFFTALLDKSRTDLHSMFVKTYGLLYQQNSQVFTSLFQDLRSYYKGNDMSLTGALDVFFKKLFSKMFELLSVPHKFSDQYLDCVTSQMQNLKPFGDTPGKLSTQVKRSFVAARTFVQGLAIGRDVILEVLKIPPTEACNKALMKMMYCPHCRGLTQTKPCNNYCLNTMKGCLAYHSELNSVWNDYIEAMKQLASRLEGPFNIESVVDPIDVKISDAIMTLQENSQRVKEQVHNGCGRPNPQNIKHKRSAPKEPQGDAAADPNMQTSLQELDKKLSEVGNTDHYDEFSVGKYEGPDDSDKSVRPTTAAGTSLDRLVKDIKEKVRVAKDFWVQLPYSVCNNEQIAAPPGNDTDCWNGKDRARYGTLVQQDGIMHQINNPEVEVDVNEANYIIEQQKLQLKIITGKLNNAFKGEEVTWVKTEIPDNRGLYGSGFAGSGDGSGSGDDSTDVYGEGGSGHIGNSGDGSDGDDEDLTNRYRPTDIDLKPDFEGSGHTVHNNNNININNNNPNVNLMPDNDEPKYVNVNLNGKVTHRTPPSSQPRDHNAGIAPSSSWWCLSVVLIFIKTLQIIMG